MSTLSSRDIEHIFETLRKGDVPTRSCDAFAVGVEAARAEIRRQLAFATDGEGTIKFLRGGYGCGKTFMARLATEDAQALGMVTSFVVVSDNDLQFHKFDEVYRKVVSELATSTCPRGALGDILDRWIGRIEQELIDRGADPASADFDPLVSRELAAKLKDLSDGRAPADFVRAIQAVFELKQQGEYTDAGALLSWLSGSGNVASASKRIAGIKGDIESTDAMDYLRGLLEIVKAAGYSGMLIVIDEAETILRMPRADSRHKSLNGIRQILDAAGGYPGLVWLFTGTPEFFDSRRGVRGLEPLHERIAFQEHNGFASLRQAQLRLTPFDRDRLLKVARRLRELFPTKNRPHLEEQISDRWLEQQADEYTKGFRELGVIPRQFLRSLVHMLDCVENEGLIVQGPERFPPSDLTPGEQEKIAGAPPADDDEGPVPVLDAW